MLSFVFQKRECVGHWEYLYGPVTGLYTKKKEVPHSEKAVLCVSVDMFQYFI